MGGSPSHRRLDVSHAFHSPLMAPMLDAYRKLVSSVLAEGVGCRPREEQKSVLVFSSLLGHVASLEELSSVDHWVRHVSEPVLYAPSLEALVDAGYDAYLEIGPKPVLTNMGRPWLKLGGPE